MEDELREPSSVRQEQGPGSRYLPRAVNAGDPGAKGHG